MARALFVAALLAVVVGSCFAGVEKVEKPEAAAAPVAIVPKSEGTPLPGVGGGAAGDLDTAAGHLYGGYGGYGGYGLGYGHGFGYGGYGGYGGGYGYGWGWPRVVYHGWGWPVYGYGHGYGYGGGFYGK